MLNVIICGTPGTGKSTLIEQLRLKLPEFKFINLSQFAIENNCIESYDEQLETKVIDEDKLLEQLRPKLLENKLNIIECIEADILSEEEYSIKWVFVLRTNNTILYDRLKARNYNELKLSNNLNAEIFQTIYDQVLECFRDDIITELTNDTMDDLDKNVDSILNRVTSLKIGD